MRAAGIIFIIFGLVAEPLRNDLVIIGLTLFVVGGEDEKETE
jgi:hypothetical protein